MGQVSTINTVLTDDIVTVANVALELTLSAQGIARYACPVSCLGANRCQVVGSVWACRAIVWPRAHASQQITGLITVMYWHARSVCNVATGMVLDKQTLLRTALGALIFR